MNVGRFPLKPFSFPGTGVYERYCKWPFAPSNNPNFHSRPQFRQHLCHNLRRNGYAAHCLPVIGLGDMYKHRAAFSRFGRGVIMADNQDDVVSAVTSPEPLGAGWIRQSYEPVIGGIIWGVAPAVILAQRTEGERALFCCSGGSRQSVCTEEPEA